jgi:hypothetical protein
MDEHKAKLDGVIAFDCRECGEWFLGNQDKGDADQVLTAVSSAVGLLFCAACWYAAFVLLAPLF